jgi:hypothetical protein
MLTFWAATWVRDDLAKGPVKRPKIWFWLTLACYPVFLPIYLIFVRKKRINLITGAVIVMTVILAANTVSFYYLGWDQFNIFYKAKETYSINDWNLPHIVEVDIDNDGIKDRVLHDNCIYLSGIRKLTDVAINRLCTTELVDNKVGIKIVPDEKNKNGKRFVNEYLLLSQDDKWYVVQNRIGKTLMLQIKPTGEIEEAKVPFGLWLDSAIYTMSHIMLIW